MNALIFIYLFIYFPLRALIMLNKWPIYLEGDHENEHNEHNRYVHGLIHSTHPLYHQQTEKHMCGLE